jgi:conserved oligomeric Golgi complex subunit 6
MTTNLMTRKVSGASDNVELLSSPTGAQALRSNPLSAKVTSVLSASYADSDIRDALDLLDKRHVQNTAETRRQLRLDIQKEVIESNGDIIREFGHVAEVRWISRDGFWKDIGLYVAATQTYWAHDCKPQPRM